MFTGDMDDRLSMPVLGFGMAFASIRLVIWRSHRQAGCMHGRSSETPHLRLSIYWAAYDNHSNHVMGMSSRPPPVGRIVVAYGGRRTRTRRLELLTMIQSDLFLPTRGLLGVFQFPFPFPWSHPGGATIRRGNRLRMFYRGAWDFSPRRDRPGSAPPSHATG